MSRSTSQYAPLRTLRQRGSAFLGWAAVVLCVAMAALSVFSGEPSLLFIGIMLLVAAVGFVCLAHPSLVITQAGLELRNPFRRTSIPWSQVQDVSPRWNLEVWAGEKAYPAWAIASNMRRARPQGMVGFGRLAKDADAAAPPPRDEGSIADVSTLIETAMGEYAELVAEGDSAVVSGGELTREWQWLDITVMAVPVVLILVGALL